MARKPIKELSVVEVEYVAHRLAQELMDFGEPIPPFDTRFPDRLESCLKTPFQKFGGKSLYPGIVLKTAMLFYFLIKNHPFQNGNKRVAVLTTIYFLSQNGRWLRVDNLALYKFAREIAESEAAENKETIQIILDFLNTYVVLATDDEMIEEEEIAPIG